ncbi:hypothetical protein AN958_00389 [Leucoagaricus sp. SymC.cos]|nr:hypothetical protein AN958_00389 [Leucoagaricus sp. SymC.cos]
MLPQIWLLAVPLFGILVVFGLVYFTPSIVQNLGYTASRAQLMTVPPFAVAFVIAMISAWVSDRYHCRGLVLVISSLMSVIGFAMFLGSARHSVQYGSLFFSIPGAYMTAPTLSTWPANNATPHTCRATAIVIGFILTNFGGILATWLLGSLSPPPRYTGATLTLLIFSVLIVVFSAFDWWYLWDQNRKKRATRQTLTRSHEDPTLFSAFDWWYLWDQNRKKRSTGQTLTKSHEDPTLGDKSAWFEHNL